MYCGYFKKFDMEVTQTGYIRCELAHISENENTY